MQMRGRGGKRKPFRWHGSFPRYANEREEREAETVQMAQESSQVSK
jgi:hypothetical protein